MKDDSWLKPRGYIHFTKKFKRGNKEDSTFLYNYVSTPETVAQHGFFPLIHRPIITRRYKKLDSSNKRGHSYFDFEKGKHESTAKKRAIFYSTHIDAYIYSYYCKEILTPLYEKKVLETKGLSDCISAYRKIPTKTKSIKNKNNIHFARDVFNFISSYGECVALTFDVSAFFDSMNQKFLKQQWCSLLGVNSLPASHYNVYKSLTRASYVDYYQILKEFGIRNQNKLKHPKFISFCESIDQFKNKVQKRGLIKEHPHTRPLINSIKSIEYLGIPQGTPISAFLSNLYMLEFDKIMHNKIVIEKGGLYRRYSDDIVVVCKDTEKVQIESDLLSIIREKYFLTINQDKVDVSNFRFKGKKLVSDKPLRYLGFDFDGSKILLKSASLSKFYRQLKYSVRSQAKRAKFNFGKKKKVTPTTRIYKHNLFKGHSHLGSKSKKRNFYLYARDASKIMAEPRILKQLSNSWSILNDEILKYEIKYSLP